MINNDGSLAAWSPVADLSNPNITAYENFLSIPIEDASLYRSERHKKIMDSITKEGGCYGHTRQPCDGLARYWCRKIPGLQSFVLVHMFDIAHLPDGFESPIHFHQMISWSCVDNMPLVHTKDIFRNDKNIPVVHDPVLSQYMSQLLIMHPRMSKPGMDGFLISNAAKARGDGKMTLQKSFLPSFNGAPHFRRRNQETVFSDRLKVKEATDL